jgi:hypothetical protein
VVAVLGASIWALHLRGAVHVGLRAWPEVLGTALAIQSLPVFVFVLSGVALKIARKALWVWPTQRAALAMFYTGGAVVAGLILFETSAEKSERPRSALGAPLARSTILRQHVITPPGADFSVTFPGEPSVSEVEALGNKGQKYEWGEEHSRSLLRAEFVPEPRGYVGAMIKELAFKDLRDIAEKNGLERIQLDWDASSSVSVASLSGFKSLIISDESIQFRYVISHHFGPRGWLTITTGCPAKDYPTPIIAQFRRSCSPRVK